MAEEVILRFDEVTFEYIHKKPLLDEASFSVRKGSKVTLMGQNGAGKSTLFGLIRGDIKPKSGRISVNKDAVVGSARQVMTRDEYELSVEDYFAKAFEIVPKNLKSKISKVLNAVNLAILIDKKVGDLSGGQQARLLLAYALIQNPDILLLDEPTNNLDKEGVEHLKQFILDYKKTCIVISHEADFLNSFSQGVLYLNLYTLKIEQYVGNYFDAVKLITVQIGKENRKNAQLGKKIQENKDKANFFAMKGGRMRLLAKKMRTEAEEMEEEKVDVRREDKTIRNFIIPTQAN